MNYAQANQYLNSFLNFERITLSPANRLWNLDRMRVLLDWFDHPERDCFPVLIAGTKGKGSTGFFLESILRAAHHRVGFYTSPHLTDPRERIRVQGRMVSKRRWTEVVAWIQKGLSKKRLPETMGDFTYFEISTLMAMLVFKRAGTQIGIFEVGLGGRWDATNILNPKLVVITPIHKDHEALLGNSIAKIAGEKAAIIKKKVDIVMSAQRRAARQVIQAKAKKERATLWTVGKDSPKPFLKGDFQQQNAAVALQAADVLRRRFHFSIPDRAFRRGLQNQNWHGRFEVIDGKPSLLLDGAHNPSSIQALVRNVKRKEDSIVIFGTTREKRSDLMLRLLSKRFREIVLVRISNPRSQEMGVLLAQAREHFDAIYPFTRVDEALAFARHRAGRGGFVAVTGSFYLIGEVQQKMRKMKEKNER